MSPRSARPGADFDVHYDVVCVTCGLVGMCPRYDVAETIIRHYAVEHPHERVSFGGTQFTATPAPRRCDTCNAVVELPYWTHVSDPPTSVGAIIDHDGLWLICDPCHTLWAADNRAGIAQRSWRNVCEQSPFLNQAGREDIVKASAMERLRLLFDRWDKGTRNTIEAPGP